MKRKADKFRAALAATGKTVSEFAKACGREDRQVDRWIKGQRPIPKYAWSLVNEMKRKH